MQQRPKWRLVLREFVIFLLLGPIATAIVFLAIMVGTELYKAPTPAPYTTRHASLIPFGKGLFGVTDLAPAPNLPTECFGGKSVVCENLDDAFYVYDWNNPEMHGKWYRFAKDIPLDRIQRTVYRTPLSAYVQVDWGDLAVISLIFGWLVGAGIWIFYRLIRFAATG